MYASMMEETSCLDHCQHQDMSRILSARSCCNNMHELTCCSSRNRLNAKRYKRYMARYIYMPSTVTAISPPILRLFLV